MIRVRFKTRHPDFRPAVWPINHPYWCTGYSDGNPVIVAYADDETEIMQQWPEAYDLDSEAATEYTFTDRFKKPDWLT